MDIAEFFRILIFVVFVNNFVLSRFLGLCPFIGVSKKSSSAFGMGMAVIFVMTISSILTWVIYNFVLVPFNAEFLRTLSFILVIAVVVQLVEMFIKKFSTPLYNALGIYLPLITTNCAVLGVAVLNIEVFSGESMSLLKSIVQGFGAGVGFLLALLLMSGIRERLELADIPKPFAGVAIAFIMGGLMALTFGGFAGFLS